jgi:beta-xylosidase
VVDADENFSASLSTLTSGTSYYIRAYVYCDSRYVYSEVVTATTESLSLDDELKNYVAPTYSDDYTSISDWSKRSQWNLANVHDPSVVLAEDGYYYMYQTDASYGNVHTAGGHFHGRRSKDLVNWEYLGGTMKNLPEWVVPKLNEIRKEMGLAEINPNVNDFGYWAPVVRKVKNGLYRMYYSIVCPGTLNGANTWSERAFIGLMENNDPSNNDGWVDKGYVITNASDKGLNFNVKPDDWANCYYKWNAIDPSYVITPEGEHWLVYGSWHSGIAALKLDGETGKPAESLGQPWATGQAPAEYGQLIATRQTGNRWQASEGPEVIYRDGYYYLFLAYDALDVPYNTRVVRSKSITGPYVGIDGKDVTAGADALPIVTHPYKFSKGYGWVGIAHCAIFDDGKDNWFYASQGRLPKDVPGINASNAIMMGHVRSIRWTKDGWPLVMPERYGAVPKVAITEEELPGNWEHIDLTYKYGEQRTSATMTLAADHTITEGIWKGSTWSYDAAQQILTVNGVELYLQRETDWEASPRTHTIVYAGYANNKTYWGKKSK